MRHGERDPALKVEASRPAARAVPAPRWRERAWELRRRIEAGLPVLLIAPSALAVGIFVYGFIGWTVYVSMTRWNDVLPDYTFVGLRNYVGLFQTPRFQADIRNTVVFTAFFLLGAVLLGFFAALFWISG
jgi:glucose/mannose transport system permease protein